jgi:hypothetical protein
LQRACLVRLRGREAVAGRRLAEIESEQSARQSCRSIEDLDACHAQQLDGIGRQAEAESGASRLSLKERQE